MFTRANAFYSIFAALLLKYLSGRRDSGYSLQVRTPRKDMLKLIISDETQERLRIQVIQCDIMDS